MHPYVHLNIMETTYVPIDGWMDKDVGDSQIHKNIIEP